MTFEQKHLAYARYMEAALIYFELFVTNSPKTKSFMECKQELNSRQIQAFSKIVQGKPEVKKNCSGEIRGENRDLLWKARVKARGTPILSLTTPTCILIALMVRATNKLGFVSRCLSRARNEFTLAAERAFECAFQTV